MTAMRERIPCEWRLVGLSLIKSLREKNALARIDDSYSCGKCLRYGRRGRGMNGIGAMNSAHF